MTTHTYTESAPLTLAQRELGFRIHALVFVPVILAQLIVNALTGGYAWSLWSLAGWGIGLAAHWFFVLGPGARHNRAG
jgi:hypothetical protein